MTQRRHPAVVNLDEIEVHTMGKGTRFGCTDRRLAEVTGGQELGCSYYEVEPGRAAFPRHYHCVNEEAVFVVEGEGTLRIGEDTVAIRKGDYVAFLAGPDHAHDIRNTGTGRLAYLCLSTMTATEVVGYPDSKKVGVRAGRTIDEAYTKPWIREIVMAGSPLGYYDGEDVG